MPGSLAPEARAGAGIRCAVLPATLSLARRWAREAATFLWYWRKLEIGTRRCIKESDWGLRLGPVLKVRAEGEARHGFGPAHSSQEGDEEADLSLTSHRKERLRALGKATKFMIVRIRGRV